MYRLIILSILQSICLSSGQLCLKQAVMKTGKWEWTWNNVFSQLTNWWWPMVGITMGLATILWLYILRHYPLSQAYPLSSISYVVGMLLGMLFLHETISADKWIGVLLILVGSYIMAR